MIKLLLLALLVGLPQAAVPSVRTGQQIKDETLRRLEMGRLEKSAFHCGTAFITIMDVDQMLDKMLDPRQRLVPG